MVNSSQTGTAATGRVVVAAKIENQSDLFLVRRGDLTPPQVRCLEVENALVDTGCLSLGLPRSMVQRLGLGLVKMRVMQTTNGPREAGVYDAVRLTVQDRDCTVDVYEIPGGCPVLIGQIPLEVMDFIVEPRSQRLVGNPEHDGEWIIDAF